MFLLTKHMSLWLDLLREGIERDKHKEIDDKERKAREIRERERECVCVCE